MNIVSVDTILFFLNLGCDKYSKDETIERKKLLFSYFFVSIHNLNCCCMVCFKASMYHLISEVVM